MTREFTLGSFFNEGVRNNCVAIIASTVWCFGGSSFLVNESDESVRNSRAAIIAGPV
ncbi:MAG: hypothetical protein PUK40_01970 [Actinomycetaceae bacterium]|nr:hypothetical protein [Arcanobacterium sp.]MDD7504710.1 hypothetical protein [Actinomycetaceae bacterium]MDY6143115.1 hypothetical protein [Arcanobacterium sp.]